MFQLAQEKRSHYRFFIKSALFLMSSWKNIWSHCKNNCFQKTSKFLTIWLSL